MRRLSFVPLLPALTSALALALSGLALPARAEPPTLAGRWSATALRAEWSIGEWGKPCGPAPSGGSASGGAAAITSAGNELQFTFPGRHYTTRECWEQFPGLARVSHSSGPRSWRNVCKTAALDPRQATIVTTLNATDRMIAFDETGQYQFVIAGQNCTASVRRSRSLSLVQREGEPEAAVAAPSPSAAAPAASTAASAAGAAPAASAASDSPAASSAPVAAPLTSACRTPGPAARLEVRPAQKRLRPGESFEFHARVLDAAGCALALSPVWSVLTVNAAVDLTASGKVHVRDTAGEGTIELRAALAGNATQVVLDIAPPAREEARLPQTMVKAEGESSDAAPTRVTTTAIGGGDAVAGKNARQRRLLFVGLVGGSALLLGLLGFVLVQLGRRKPLEPAQPPRARRSPPTMPGEMAPFAKICPTCREEYAADAAFCPNDGNRLVAVRGASEALGPSGGVCPVCGQGYDPGVSTCPNHGEDLVPVAMHGAPRSSASSVIEKICPTCGRQYAGDSQFCGGCGTSLVPVN